MGFPSIHPRQPLKNMNVVVAFVELGLNEYEIYDAAQCYNATDRIVSDVLSRPQRSG